MFLFLARLREARGMHSLLSRIPVRYQVEEVEGYVVVFFVLLSFLAPHLWAEKFEPLEQRFRRFASR